MISETEGFTVQNILRWMGDLENERIVAKHAARQGLVCCDDLTLGDAADTALSTRHLVRLGQFIPLSGSLVDIQISNETDCMYFNPLLQIKSILTSA